MFAKSDRVFKMLFFFMVSMVSLIAGSMVSSSCHNRSLERSGQYQRRATEEANSWANEMYPGQPARVSCQNSDSDYNGYVSCTVRVENETLPIECANPDGLIFANYNHGCRMITYNNIRNRR